jgi:hypothetical protein
MPKLSQGTLTLAGLAAFAVWLFVVLPFLYGPPPRFVEASSPPQTHTEQSSEQSATKPDGSVNAPFFIRIPKTAKEEAEEAAERHEKTSTDRWLMIFTGAVALFTLLLVGATVLLYRAGEKQLRLSTRTAEWQLRAYLHVERAMVENIEDPKKRVVKIHIKNFGQTPALHVITKIGEHVREWPLKTDLGDFPEDLRRGITPLGPGGWHYIMVPVGDLSPWEEGQLQAGKAGIYAWGEVTYFALGEKRTTTFRLVCEGEGLPTGAMHPTETGNDAD